MSPEQRKAGAEIRTKSQREAAEAELGVRPMSARELGAARQAQQADREEMFLVGQKEGREAVFDYVDKTEVINATGWDTSTYNRWKEGTDAAAATVSDSNSL